MNENMNQKTSSDGIDIIELIITFLKYKKLFLISYLLMIVLFGVFYFFSLKTKIEYKKSITFYTGIPQSFFNLEKNNFSECSLQTVKYSDSEKINKLYVLNIITPSSNRANFIEKTYFKNIKTKYLPILQERLNKYLKLLTEKKLDLSLALLPDYKITMINNSFKKYKTNLTKKLFPYFILSFILLFFIDIFLIYSFEFVKKIKKRLKE